MEILFDGGPIFTGELKRATGDLHSPEDVCEHILFTTDEEILRKIEERDWLPSVVPEIGDPTYFEELELLQQEDASTLHLNGLPSGQRPQTGELPRVPGAGLPLSAADSGSPAPGTRSAAMTAASAGGSVFTKSSSQGGLLPGGGVGDGLSATGTGSADGRPLTSAVSKRHPTTRVEKTLSIAVHQTWGDDSCCGVTAIQVLDVNLQSLEAVIDQIHVIPTPVREMGDVRWVVVGRAENGLPPACTTDPESMWCGQIGGAEDEDLEQPTSTKTTNAVRLWFQIEFAQPVNVSGLNIWNYNCPGLEMRGWKTISLYSDENFCATYMVRRGPGHTQFDFKQLILLSQAPAGGSHHGQRERVPSFAGHDHDSDEQVPRTSVRVSSSSSVVRPGPVVPGSSSQSFSSRGTTAQGAAGTRSTTRRPPMQFEAPLHPCGFALRIKLKDTWGDVHYIGLDHVEILGRDGKTILPSRVFSKNGSVRDLQGMESDGRVPERVGLSDAKRIIFDRSSLSSIGRVSSTW